MIQETSDAELQSTQGPIHKQSCLRVTGCGHVHQGLRRAWRRPRAARDNARGAELREVGAHGVGEVEAPALVEDQRGHLPGQWGLIIIETLGKCYLMWLLDSDTPPSRAWSSSRP